MDRAIKGWHWCGDLRRCDDAPMRSILVVDDYEPFRLVVRQMLERDGFQVVGEAADGTAAIDAAWSLRPEVILLDVHLPGEDGFTICERLQDVAPVPEVVLTSSHDVGSFRRRLRTSRAKGFISKGDLTPAALVALLEAPVG
jgi:DNA-binding NarL/FixJ family response regulator